VKIINKERFLTCLVVLVILHGLYIAIGTIEKNQEPQIQAVMVQWQ
jgi:hypothetical protein